MRNLQLTPSNFKYRRIMACDSPLSGSGAAAEKQKYHELLESIYYDSLEQIRSDDNASRSEVSSSESEVESITPVSRKVPVQSKVNKARRRFRF